MRTRLQPELYDIPAPPVGSPYCNDPECAYCKELRKAQAELQLEKTDPQTLICERLRGEVVSFNIQKRS